MSERKFRLFASPFSGKVYVTSSFREIKPGVFEVTGKKYDVTEDFRALAKSATTEKGEESL